MKRIRLLSLNLIILFLLLTLSIAVSTQRTTPSDFFIIKYIYSLRSPHLTSIMTLISLLSDTTPQLLLSAILTLLLFRLHKRDSIVLVFALIIANLASAIIKLLLHIPRPTISPLENLSDFSFPSGHALNNFLLYALVIHFLSHFIKHKMLLFLLSLICFSWVLVIGFSRLYLGVHFPSDVLGGYLLGAWLFTLALFIKTHH